jgi:hypothetical protein
LRAQRSAGLAAESDLICAWLHWNYASQSVVCSGVSVSGGGACVVTWYRVIRGFDAMAAVGPHPELEASDVRRADCQHSGPVLPPCVISIYRPGLASVPSLTVKPDGLR